MAVRRPTLDQLRSVAEDLGMHMGDEELKSYDALMQANYAAYDAVDAMPDYVPAVKYPRTPGYRPEGEENKYNAWYVKTDDQGRAERQARRQDDRAEGQYLPRRRADDERRLDARGLHARHRCDHRHPHARCRRHHPRQGALRIFLLLRRQPHLRGRSGPQSAQDGLFGRRLVFGQRASWWRPARPIWRSAATRADRSASRRPSAASTA